MLVKINNIAVNIDPTKSIGKGGEADIYNLGSGKALKLFKTVDHPDVKGSPLEELSAKNRLKEHQSKLPSFPTGLPANVITPIDLAYDKTGKKIVGYTMNLVDNASVLYSFSQRMFRQGISNNEITQIFLKLFSTVNTLHKNGIVIGDFNDLNVLVNGQNPYIIDSDSFQFGHFLARSFTQDFTDPLNANPNSTAVELIKPFNHFSDWYAFAVLLFQSYLFVKPYGGSYKPKDQNNRVSHTKRPLERITVFDDEVKYPVKQALHYSHLSPDLLDYFYQIFKSDLREVFDKKMLENIEWKTCKKCGLEHATYACPSCVGIVPGHVVQTIVIKGNLKASKVFNTKGFIVYSKVESGVLKYIYHSNGAYYRENGEKIIDGEIDNQIRFRINSRNTLLSKKGILVTIKNTQIIDKVAVGSCGILPVFDSNSLNRFWISAENIYKQGTLGPEPIGKILSKQTVFWVGEKLGFGFYRAGDLNVGFIFDTSKHAILDSIDFPIIPGKLLDVTCYISDKLIWFFASFMQNGNKTNRCIVYDKQGKIQATKEEISSVDSWLTSIRGKTVYGDFLMSATDSGIVQLKVENSQIIVKNSYPDTASYVDDESIIHLSNEGIYVVDYKEITLLQLH